MTSKKRQNTKFSDFGPGTMVRRCQRSAAEADARGTKGVCCPAWGRAEIGDTTVQAGQSMGDDFLKKKILPIFQ